jgi:NTP pyrophosphatase (non-canonical NTP hydrolase)
MTDTHSNADLFWTFGDSVMLSRALRCAGENIHETKVAKGWTVTGPDAWDQENQIPADLALIHSEVSEALEAFRRGDRDEFASELADVLIRVVGLAHGLGIDVGVAMTAKMTANRAREHRHGGKRI